MIRPLALLRPQPGWSRTARAARDLGLAVIGQPLFVAEPLAWNMPDGPFDALLIGSGAVFRHGGPRLADLRALPVHAVGAATATAAQSHGFVVARTGEGGLQALLDTAPVGASRYLRLGGEERVPLAPLAHQAVTDCAVYRMAPRTLAPALIGELNALRPLVALHSAAAARHFAAEVDRTGLARGALVLLALGSRIAEAAGRGWAAVHLADTPSDAALLAKAAALCK